MYSEHLVELILAQLYLRFKLILMIFTYNLCHFTKQTAILPLFFSQSPKKHNSINFLNRRIIFAHMKILKKEYK